MRQSAIRRTPSALIKTANCRHRAGEQIYREHHKSVISAGKSLPNITLTCCFARFDLYWGHELAWPAHAEGTPCGKPLLPEQRRLRLRARRWSMRSVDVTRGASAGSPI